MLGTPLCSQVLPAHNQLASNVSVSAGSKSAANMCRERFDPPHCFCCRGKALDRRASVPWEGAASPEEALASLVEL